jgi:hypothetical protein
MGHPTHESCSSVTLADTEWCHPEFVSFLNVNNLVFVLALASLLIMLNGISLVHQVHL